VTKAFDDEVLRHLAPFAHPERRLQPQQLARFERAAYVLAGADTRRSIAQALVDAGLAAIGAATGVVVLLSPDGDRLHLVASAGYDADFLQPWTDFPLTSSTPLADAVRSRRPVLVSSVGEMRRRYPQVELAGSGPQAFLALPLIADGDVLGAWGLRFEAEPMVSLNSDTVAAGEVLTHIAAARVEHADAVADLEERVNQLQHALDSRVLIEQAKGILAERHGVEVKDAFEAIRRQSRNEGRKIRDVSADVVQGQLDPMERAPRG
jgi:hypothetical protein